MSLTPVGHDTGQKKSLGETKGVEMLLLVGATWRCMARFCVFSCILVSCIWGLQANMGIIYDLSQWDGDQAHLGEDVSKQKAMG